MDFSILEHPSTHPKGRDNVFSEHEASSMVGSLCIFSFFANSSSQVDCPHIHVSLTILADPHIPKDGSFPFRGFAYRVSLTTLKTQGASRSFGLPFMGLGQDHKPDLRVPASVR